MRTRLSVNESSFAKLVAPSRFVPRLLVILALLALSGVAALARGPVFNQNPNLIVMPQGGTTNILFTIVDDAVGWSGIQTTTATFATNGGFANSILTVTNFASPYGPSNGWTNKYSNETNRLTIIPGNQFGTNLIVLVSVDLWGDSTTNTWTLQVYHVSQPPSFTLAATNFAAGTTNLVVLEESGLQTNHFFVTGVTNGAGNPPGLTWTFAAFTSSTTSSNGGVTFLKLPTISYNGTNGITADLVFAPTNHSYGSNLVSVVMTDSGSSIQGGKIACTNTFELVVSKIVHPPVFAPVTNLTMLENVMSGTNATISVTGDSPGSPLGLTVISGNTSAVLASVTVTNIIVSGTNVSLANSGPSTNSTFTVVFTPVLNWFGPVTNQLIASEVSGGITYLNTNTLIVNVGHVSQPPSFSLASNVVVLAEESGAQALTNFVSGISSGAGNPTDPLAQFSFAVTTVTNNSTNAQFSVLPATGTNGILTFTPAAHSFGTNLVTVTLTDNAQNTNSGGVKTLSKTFSLQVAQISHVPTITTMTNWTILENGNGANVNINVWNYNAVSNNLALTAVSAGLSNATSVVNVSYVSTNVMSATNSQFTLHLAPVSNSYGTNIITLTASNLAGTTNVSNSSFRVVVNHVTQPPSFVFSITNVTTWEQATSAVVTIPSFLTAITNGAGNLPPWTNWTFAPTVLSNSSLFSVAPAITHNGTLTFTPAKLTNGTTTVAVVMTDTDSGENTTSGGVTAFTNRFNLTVAYLSQSPSFSFATNTLVALEETGAQTNLNFVTAINPGLGKAGVTWTFTALTATNDPINNAQFTVWPAIATNGTLTFTPVAHIFGTNLVTVVMADSGTNGSCTNTFQLEVAQIAHAPLVMWATNQTTLENGGGLSSVVNVWDYDAAASNFVLTAVSQNTNLAQVSVTATNIINQTNVQFTLTYLPVTDAFGTSNIVLTAGEVVGTNLLSSTTNFALTVAHVSQPPSFAFASNAVVLAENAGTINLTNFVTTITNGAGNPANLTWTFAVSTPAAPGNVAYAPFQSPTVSPSGTLSLKAVDYGFGTNTVTVVMTDSGAIDNNGVISATNSFQLKVIQGPAYPQITGLASKTILENATTNLSMPFTLFDPLTTIFNVSCSSSDPTVLGVSVLGNGTACTLQFAPVTNSFGTVLVTVTADNGIVTNSATMNVNVVWVNQAPSFTLTTNTYTVDKYNVPVSIPLAVLNISAGPASDGAQNLALVLTNASNSLFQTPVSVNTNNGTLTFTPGDQGGTVVVGFYVHDGGGTANGGVDTSPIQTLTITIPANTLQNAAGTFTGLFYSSNTVASASSGLINLALSADGVFTGNLLCGNDNNPFSGQFDIAQSAASVQAGNYTLNLTVDTTAKVLSGSVTNTASHWNSAVRGYLSGYGTALDGAYTAILPGFDVPKIGSVGDSTFYIDIAGGAASLTGNLSDSNQVVQASPLCANGYFPVYCPLYTNASGANGLLIGWLNFNGVADDSTSPDSTLIWISQTNATALYPHGFTNNAAPLLSTFDATKPQLLPINKGYVEMTGGTLTLPVVAAVSIVNNQVLPDSPNADGLTLTINTNNGEIQGSFVDHGSTNVIESAIMQNDDVARGYFLGAGQSGSFILVANAVLPNSPPYPAFTGIGAHGAATVVGDYAAAGITNLVIPENSSGDLRVSFSLYDPVASTFHLACSSANPGVVGVSLSGDNLLFTLVTNVYGSNITVTVTADDGTLTNTFNINTTISYVNQAPSFTLTTNAYTVDKYGFTVTAPNEVVNISAGPPIESLQTVSFIVTNNNNSLFLVQPAVDASGTLTFTPGSTEGTAIVSVQALDTGGTDNNGVNVSPAQLVTITIPHNQFSGLLTGPNNTATFNGLFNDTNAATPNLGSSGSFSLVLTNDGTFTGYQIVAGASNSFSGQFSISTTNATVTAANDTFSLILDPNAKTVNGSVVSSSPSWTATLQSYLAAAPVLAGTYLVSLPGLAAQAAGPVGNSVFTAVISPDGTASLTGYLADNTPVSLTSQLSAAGNCPIYLPIYTNSITPGPGLLFGWLTFTNTATENLTANSTLTWFNIAGDTTLYAAGFTNQSAPVASSYTSTAPNELPGISYYAVLTGGRFGATLVTNAVTIVNDSITVDPSATDALSLTIHEDTGTITGSLVDGNGVTNYIQSVILQDASVASGYFTTAADDQAGSFVLLGSYTVPTGSTMYPEATGLTNVVMLENSPALNIPFVLFDPLTNDITSVTAVSDDTGFVTVNLTGSGTAYTLQLTPVPNTYTNSVAVTVVATDGTLFSTNTVNVTVTWVNQAPTFTLNVVTNIVDQFNAVVTIPNAVTGVSSGPGNTNTVPVSFNFTNNGGGLFVTPPAIDGSGTLTFTPGNQGGTVTVGVQADNHLGVANGGTETSGFQTFTIIIPGNQFQNLTGNNGTGTFTGLFYETTNVAPSSSGFVTLTLTNNGNFNVNLVSVGVTNSVSGQFSISNNTANVAVANYELGLAIDTAAGTVWGSVTNTADNWTADLLTYLATNPVVNSGQYTVVLPGFDDLAEGPSGDSVFNVGISNGVATLNGYLSDNTPVSQVGLLSAAGNCPIYLPLYPNGTNGLLIGWLTFTNDQENSSVTGDSSLLWFKAVGATSNLYPNGFTNQQYVTASPYATNADYANNLLGFSHSSGYGYLLLSGGDLGANPVVKKVGITNNIISLVSSADKSKVGLNIITNTGMINGWYIDPKGFSNNIEGAIFQNAPLSTGYFSGVTTNQVGLFLLIGN